MINEVAQWAVLVFLSVLALGLTRQLGHFLLPHNEQVMQTAPEVGSVLPDTLLDAGDRQALAALAAGHESGLAGVVVLNEECNGCQAMIEDLESGAVVRHGPLVAVVKESEAAFVGRAATVFDFVVDDEDGDRVSRTGLAATPFLLLVDSDLRVTHRDFGGAVHTGLTERGLISTDEEPASTITTIAVPAATTK